MRNGAFEPCAGCGTRNRELTEVDTAGAARGKPFNPLRVIVPVLAALLAVSAFSQWYAHSVSLPRYCDDPAHALAHLERTLSENRPADDGSRRPYIVAAKLLFLVPREADEAQAPYLERVRHQLQAQCR